MMSVEHLWNYADWGESNYSVPIKRRGSNWGAGGVGGIAFIVIVAGETRKLLLRRIQVSAFLSW